MSAGVLIDRGALRVPKSLAALLVTAELLFVFAVGFSVDTDARIRATVSAGETIVAAIASYEVIHGKPPERLEQLVPRFLGALPPPLYGLGGSWEYRAGDFGKAGDVRVGITVPVKPALNQRDRPGFTLSVRLDPDDAALHFRRGIDGCWRLPELPRCW